MPLPELPGYLAGLSVGMEASVLQWPGPREPPAGRRAPRCGMPHGAAPGGEPRRPPRRARGRLPRAPRGDLRTLPRARSPSPRSAASSAPPRNPPLTPFEHQRGRLALLRAAAAPAPPRPRHARRLTLLGVSAGVALASLAAAPRHLAPAHITVARHLPAEVLRPAEPAAVLVETTPPAEPAPPLAPLSGSTGEGGARKRGQGGKGREAGERPSDDASRAFNDAVETLGRGGDYAAARARLEAFRAAHPGDARADLASFLAIVALQHAGRHAEAQEAARRYLELYPAGDRRAEALRVAAGALTFPSAEEARGRAILDPQ